VLDRCFGDHHGSNYERCRNDRFLEQVRPPAPFPTLVERKATFLLTEWPGQRRGLLRDALSRSLRNHDRGETPQVQTRE
jgi:hypothetical protein